MAEDDTQVLTLDQDEDYLNGSINGDHLAHHRLYYRKKHTFSDDANKFLSYINNSYKNSVENLKRRDFYKNLLFKRFPVFKWLFMEYSLKNNLIHDVMAGSTVGIMNMPQSMGYALLANLPAVHGLYMSFFPIFVYFILGTSKHLAIGSIAIVSLFSGDIIQSMGDDYRHSLINQNISANATDSMVTSYKIQVACALASFVGLLQFLMGLTGLGIVTNYFSDAFISAYTSSSAVHVLVSQLKDLLGLKNTIKYNGAFKIPRTLFDIGTKLPGTNITTLIISIICIFYLIIFKEIINPRVRRIIRFEFPSELLLVVGVTIASYFGKFNKRFNVDIVKSIPRGLPEPEVPNIKLWNNFYKSGILTALIAFSISISLAKLYAKRNKYDIDATQELYAYGSSNIFASFFGCFPAAGSLTRTTMMNNCGSKSQIASLFSAIIILTVILWIGPYFEPLAIACLASIIVVALKNLLFQVKDFPYLWKINKFESISWLGTYLSVVLLDVDIGLFLGLLTTILIIVIKDQKFAFRKFIKYKDLPIYLDKDFIRCEAANDQANIKVLKIERSLYFVNIDSFKKQIKNVIEENVSTAEGKEKLKYLLIDFSAVNYVDTTAVKTLLELIVDLRKEDVFIYICQSQENFNHIINRMDLVFELENHLFPTVHDAFVYIQDQNQ